jgi:hypothetical protein
MGIEERLIRELKKTISSGDNICYFGMDLIKRKYNPKRLAELAKKDNVLAQRLGYLAEVCAEASKVSNLFDYYKKLSHLHKALENGYSEWCHLHPHLPEWGKRLFMYKDAQAELNKKWRVYTGLRLEEIEDFIDLYITRDYRHFTLLERYELGKRGIKYTRLLRNGKTKAG